MFVVSKYSVLDPRMHTRTLTLTPTHACTEHCVGVSVCAWMREREREAVAAASIYLLDLSKYLFKLDFNGERGMPAACLTP